VTVKLKKSVLRANLQKQLNLLLTINRKKVIDNSYSLFINNSIDNASFIDDILRDLNEIKSNFDEFHKIISEKYSRLTELE